VGLKLYRSTLHCPSDVPENDGIDNAERLLLALQDRGVTAEVLDTAVIPECEREAAYYGVATVAMRTHVRVRRVFDSNGVSGIVFFEREVPALLAKDEESAQPTDVYPQERAGTTITIRDYVAGL
jgi:hypothetical protein